MTHIARINQAVDDMQSVATTCADDMADLGVPNQDIRTTLMTMAAHIAGRLVALAASDDISPSDFAHGAAPILARQIAEIGAECGEAIRRAEAAARGAH